LQKLQPKNQSKRRRKYET